MYTCIPDKEILANFDLVVVRKTAKFEFPTKFSGYKAPTCSRISSWGGELLPKRKEKEKEKIRGERGEKERERERGGGACIF